MELTGGQQDERAISHGEKSSNKGERGVTKRLDALAALTDLRGNRLLDIGCGDGAYTIPLAVGWNSPGFEEVLGIDIEPERLSDFRDKLAGPLSERNIEVHNMSADDMSVPDGSFDVVTAIEVMEHVGSVPAVLSEVHRVLVPGGRFLVTTPNRWFPLETHGPMINGKRRKVWVAPGLPWIRPLHNRWSDARAFTLSEFVTAAERAGFRLVDSTYIMPPFDANPVGKRLRWVADRVERSRLSFFGMALVMVFEALP